MYCASDTELLLVAVGVLVLSVVSSPNLGRICAIIYSTRRLLKRVYMHATVRPTEYNEGRLLPGTNNAMREARAKGIHRVVGAYSMQIRHSVCLYENEPLM